MAMPFKNVDSFFLWVADIPKAIEWYTSVLDCKLLWQNSEGGFAAIEICGLPLTLVQHRGVSDFKPLLFAPFNLYTENIEEAYDYLKEKGVEAGEIDILYDVKWFWFTDLDGNRLEACSYEQVEA